MLLAAALQTHFSLNAAAQYRRFARPAELEWPMPRCWVGFGVAMLPGGALCRRHGAWPVLAVAALFGAGSALLASCAASLDVLIASQLVAGAA